MNTVDLSQYEITGPTVLANLSAAALYEEAIRYDHGTCISSTGALVAYSGDKTGRSPKDKQDRPATGLGKGYLVGTSEFSIRRIVIQNKPGARPRLSFQPRSDLRCRWLRWMGSGTSDKNSGGLLPGLSRLVYSDHVNPPRAARAE
jgi:hypothetical protein